LESVAAQDYPFVEHIVVDGASTDGSVEIIQSWALTHPIRWVSGPDNGQADAIRRGAEMATGTIVAWLNSDDVYLGPSVISDVVDLFNAGALVVTAGGWYLSESGKRLRRIRVRADRIDHAALRCTDWILQPATFFTAEAFRSVPIDTGLHYAFDWDLFIKLSDRMTFTPLDRDLAGYRIHGKAKTVSGAAKRQEELLEVIRRYHGRGSARYQLLRAVVAIHRASRLLPDPLSRLASWLLHRFAEATHAMTNGRGIPF
jgi:glycosyltransferase involved in cell wall biosynthesis